MRGLAFVVVCATCALAAAEPLPVKRAEAVRVSVANRPQRAIALRALAAGAGWRLDLAADGDSADIIDVTPGTPARTLTVAVVGRTLKLDALRFAGGHVYRVQLHGERRDSWSFVYLYPDASTLKLPPRKAGTAERVRFEPDEAAAPSDDGAPARTDKGAL